MASELFGEESHWLVTWRVARKVVPGVGRYAWRVNALLEQSNRTAVLMLVCEHTGTLACVVDAQPAELLRAGRHLGWSWFDDTRVRLMKADLLGTSMEGWT
jgi:hypothetical protein